MLEDAREHPQAADEHAFLQSLRRCPLAEGNAKRFLMDRFRPPHHLLEELALASAVHVWIPPSVVFAYVYEHFPEMFVTMFGANRAELARFWRGLRGGSRNGLRLVQALDIEDESATALKGHSKKDQSLPRHRQDAMCLGAAIVFPSSQQIVHGRITI